MISGLAIYEPRTFRSLLEIASRRTTSEPSPEWWKLVPSESAQSNYDELQRENQETLLKKLENQKQSEVD